jgi:hypothetical protein
MICTPSFTSITPKPWSSSSLIVGHGTAKDEFASFIRDHVPALAPRIMGVETVDQPTKGEILAFARKFFEVKDRTTPQLNAAAIGAIRAGN